MGSIRQYMFSIIVVAFICSIASALVPPGKNKDWIRLICGLVLTVAIIRPLPNISDLILDFPSLESWPDGTVIASQGEKMAQQSMADIITASTQAYILDKATALGLSITAEVTVSDDSVPIPVCAVISGTVTPYTRLQLEGILQDELGITKEHIQWKE